MLKPQELVFGSFLEQRRIKLQITQAKLAQILGYSNVNKGIRRIKEIESGTIEESLVLKIMGSLNVSEHDRQKCALAEELSKKRLVKELAPFKPKLVWRAVGCIHFSDPIPNSLKQRSSIIAYAKKIAIERHRHCRLELDYDLRYYISPDGEISRADKRLFNNKSAKPGLGDLI